MKHAPKGRVMNDAMNWRYATKKFDPSKKIPRHEFEELMECLRLSPSSFGLQPWKFIIVRDPALRAVLRTHAWNHPQVTDADILIVFCALKTMDEGYMRRYLDRIAEIRGVTKETLLRDMQKMMVAL